MRTVWSLLILLVSVVQGNVYLRCVYLISLYNAAWYKGVLISLKLKLKVKLLNVQKGNHIKTIHAKSPVCGTNLLLSRTGHQTSQIKSSFDLFCALVWDLAYVSRSTVNNNNNNSLLFIRSKNTIQMWSNALYFSFSQLQRF